MDIKEMKYFVYQLKRSAEAPPFYIGLTRDPDTRSLSHKRKHGMSIEFSILHEYLTEDEAIAKENELIKWHSEHGNIVNLQGVEGTRKAQKGVRQLLNAERAERKRLRLERATAEALKKRARSEERQRRALVKAAGKSPKSVMAALVVLRGLLQGEPTDKETALQALELCRVTPGAMELARVYINANII